MGQLWVVTYAGNRDKAEEVVAAISAKRNSEGTAERPPKEKQATWLEANPALYFVEKEYTA